MSAAAPEPTVGTYIFAPGRGAPSTSVTFPLMVPSVPAFSDTRDSNIKSKRQLDYERWKTEFDNYTEDKGYIVASIAFGNTCNLKCRMCNPHASNQWVREWHLIADALSDYDFNRLKNMNWPEDAKTWENVMKVVDTIDTIYLTGGEPTIIGAHHILLDFLIDFSFF